MSGKILLVDDDPLTLDLLEQQLAGRHYTVERAGGGEEALKKVEAFVPDVILLDLMMPDVDGMEVLHRLRQDERYRATPVILVTALGAQEDKVRGLEAGADDYVVKPFDETELLARVHSMLRIKHMHDALEQWGRTLEDKVRQQVSEIQRLARLKRYLPPQIADEVLKGEEDALFKGHRREVTVVVVDLDRFTAFTERAEPEEVLALLRDFHTKMGDLVFRSGGTVELLMGDGMTILFNDPVPSAEHTGQAVRMALEMRAQTRLLREQWLRTGYDLDLRIGLAAGYATLGEIGFEARREYAAVGHVTGVAAALCQAAKGGQILTDRRTLSRIDELVAVEALGELRLRGLTRPAALFNITGLRHPPKAAADPLSPREREVALLVSQGLSSRQIAKKLYISERTAESHVQSIMNKLGFHARTQIAAWASARDLPKS